VEGNSVLNDSRKRAVIYSRVSKEEQRKTGFSLPSQVRLCRERMERDRVKEAHPPIEDAESGRNFDRGGIGKLLELAEGGYIDYVYVHSLDRLGRNVAETPYFMYQLKERGVIVQTPEREYRLEKPIDFVIAVIDSLSPDEESRRLGERTLRGKVEKFRQGKWVGPVPFGYKKVGDKLEKVPDRERVVREVFQTFIKRMDVKATTAEINEQLGNRIGQLSICQIRRILSNPIYVGRPAYAKIQVNNPSLAMISPEYFDEVQERLTEKAKRRASRAKKPRSILDNWAKKFGADYEVRVLDELKPICPKCRSVKIGGNGSKVISGIVLK
jgi:site-specific DNA recombinase